MEHQSSIGQDLQITAPRRMGRLAGKGLVATLATATGITIGNLVGREVGGPMGYDSVIQFSAGGVALGLAGGLTYLKYAANQGRNIAKGAAVLLATILGTGIGLEAGRRNAPPQYGPGDFFTSREYHTHVTRSAEYGALVGTGAGVVGAALSKRKKK